MTGDQCDPLVPPIEQVLDRFAHAGVVVTQQRRRGDPRKIAVDEHERQGQLADRLEGCRVVLTHEVGDEPVDAAATEHVDVGRLQVGVAVRVDEQHDEAVLAELALGAVGDGGEERVGDVADDETDGVRRASAQALGEKVGLVAELGGGPSDAPAHRRADVGVIAERP